MKLMDRLTDSDLYGGPPEWLSSISRKAARGVLMDEHDRVALMFMARRGLYKLPGGGMEAGESREETFLRELLEETGCEAEITHELGYFEEHKVKNRYMQVSYCYIARALSCTDEIKLTENERRLGMQVRWMSWQEARERMREAENERHDYSSRFMVLRDRRILEAAYRQWSQLPEGRA
ncbi:NUDIX domain-containing protein [Paenibacillus aurantius]|uniref:NUDIX domain-containing protein n=1 Tax=Paenibacillus aurantius TaxID=2918900 RepID=A0AA96LFL3_9BACL|nr:NUDIX domain-containing protein [Paenibacillus aurantius]WNQ10637.1 NUDIX domain-containing protein [Paenibacillus aurantius]